MNVQVYFYPQWAYASVLENTSWDDLFHHQGMIMLTNRERNRHPAPFVASQESYIGRLTCYYNLLLQPSKDDSSYTLNQHLKPVVNFRINTVQMMLINRCSFITFTFRMMGSDIIKIIIHFYQQLTLMTSHSVSGTVLSTLKVTQNSIKQFTDGESETQKE